MARRGETNLGSERGDARVGVDDLLRRELHDPRDQSRPDPEAVTPVITTRGLTKKYGRNLAVDDVGFNVPPGKVTGFLGPNGAGKSTTMRMILALTPPTSGEATVMGRPYRSLRNPGQQVGAILESSAFHPRRTARNHLRVLAAAARVEERRIDEVLGIVELSKAANKNVGEFSLGMRQRLGLAGALLGDPALLILDEPANGLDPSGIRWLREFLKAFADRGNAVFVSSHILAEVSQMAHEVVVINRGSLVVHAPVEELTSGAARVVLLRTPQADRMLEVLSDARIDAVLAAQDELTVKGSTPEQVGTLAAQAGVVVYGLESRIHSLEEVFFELTDSKEGIR